MNILIVGASSFIGQSIYMQARQKKYQVVGTRYSNSSNPQLLTYDLTQHDIFKIIPTEFMNSNNICAVICSAIPKIDICYREKERSNNLNVTRTIELIKELQAKNIKTVFLSTDAVFDGIQGYYDEASQSDPLNQYGLQKREVENFILSGNPDDLIVRMGIVVGDNPNVPHLFTEWYEKVRNRQPIECIKGQVFSPTYIEDVANAILIALERKLSGIYHITNPEYFERAELARQFLALSKEKTIILEKELHEFNFSQKRAIKTYLDSSKFRTETNMPFTSMKEVMKNFMGNLEQE